VSQPELVPLLRGVSHAYAFWVALVAGGVLVALAPTGEARVAAAIYGLALSALFAASGSTRPTSSISPKPFPR